jgi:hypothetical protein
MKKPLIAAAAAASVALLAACGSTPQNRREYTKHPGVSKETYTVPRPLDAVIASFNKQAKACVNGESGHMAGKIVAASRTAREMTVKKTSANQAELTMRMASNNMIGMPEGGYYVYAGDLKAQGANTQVTLYHGGSSQEDLTKAVKEWSKGNDKSCHGIGG